jgi:hypothetical protein
MMELLHALPLKFQNKIDVFENFPKGLFLSNFATPRGISVSVGLNRQIRFKKL